MSNRAKSRKNKHKVDTISDKRLSYGTIGGLILGVIIGTVISIITDNMFWMACTPIVTLFIGLFVSSYIPIKKKSK